MSSTFSEHTPIPASAFYVEIDDGGELERFYPYDVADMGHSLSRGYGMLSIYLPLSVDNAVDNPTHKWWLAFLAGDKAPRVVRVVYEHQGHTLILSYKEARTIQHRYANISTATASKNYITEVLTVSYARCDTDVITNRSSE